MKILFSLVSILTAVSAQAAELTWETDQTDPVELTEDTTITVPAGKTVTCSGVISGVGKLIKAGTGRLILSAENTYTGGTQIDGGKLQADNAQAFGPVNADLPIQVNSDCSQSSPTDAKVVALVVNCASFAYPINFSEWTNPLAKPPADGTEYKYLYNLCVSYPANNSGDAAATLSGKITGGGLALRVGDLVWGTFNKVKAPTFSNDIYCPNGVVYLVTRGANTVFGGKVTAARFLLPTGGTPPAAVTFKHANEIGEIDVGRYASAGGVTVNSANGLYKAKVISRSAAIYSSDSAFGANVACGSNAQEIDVPMAYLAPSASVGKPTNCHRITCDGTLTMNASQGATNDWVFAGNANSSLVWDPQDDCTLLNVSRPHTISGAIAVKGGCFAMDENCTFSNVVKIVVHENASVSNMCAFAGSFNAVADVTLGENAALWVAENPFASKVKLDLAAGAKLHVPDGVQLTVTSVKYDGKYQKVGDHTTDDYMVGGGTVKVLTNPGAVEETVVWQGGMGTGFNTAANWVGKTDVPDFEEGLTTLRFAAQGTENLTAMVDVDAYVKGVEFGDVPTFKIAGDGTHSIALGAGGILADGGSLAEPAACEISAPLSIAGNQAWIATNAAITVSGPLVKSSLVTARATVTVRNFVGAPFWFRGDAGSTFDGDFNLMVTNDVGTHYSCGGFYATGLEPFGPLASDGSGTVTLTGRPGSTDGTDAALYVSNAVISKTISFVNRYRGYIRSLSCSTNVFNGPIVYPHGIYTGKNTSLAFNGPFSIFPESSVATAFPLRSTESDNNDMKLCDVYFNGPVKYSKEMNADTTFGHIHFNAPSNEFTSINSKGYVRWHFGCDYALSDGKTEWKIVNLSETHFDIEGHPQHIGSLNAGRTTTEINSTGGAALLRVNQTKNVTYLGTIAKDVMLVKEGDSKLGFSATFSCTNVTVRAGTLELSGTAKLPDAATVTLAGDGVLSLPPDTTDVVEKLYYVDVESGETRPAPRGLYSATSVPEGLPDGFAAHFAGGTLRVRKSDIKLGLMLFIR